MLGYPSVPSLWSPFISCIVMVGGTLWWGTSKILTPGQNIFNMLTQIEGFSQNKVIKHWKEIKGSGFVTNYTYWYYNDFSINRSIISIMGIMWHKSYLGGILVHQMWKHISSCTSVFVKVTIDVDAYLKTVMQIGKGQNTFISRECFFFFFHFFMTNLRV